MCSATNDPFSRINSTDRRSISRRTLLKASGAGLAASIFAGDFAAASTRSMSGKSVRHQDGSTEYHAAWGWLDPGAGGHFNSFVTNAILPPPSTIYGDLILAPLGMYYWESQTWLPLLATEWAFINSQATDSATPVDSSEADTFEVKLREGVSWSDGSPFTAADVDATMWCFRMMSNTVWDYIDSVDVIDDYTVRFHMSTPSTVVERYIIRASNPRPASVFGEWADKAKDLYNQGKTMDDPEGRQLLDQFTQFRPESVPASGPYFIDIPSITNAQMTLPKNESCWIAENAKFDRIINFNGETDTITPIVLSKDIDYAGNAFSPTTERQMLDSGIRVLRPPTYSGPALLFNFKKLGAAFGDKRARQALAHIIDRYQVGFVSLADSGVPSHYMSGMSDNLAPKWLSESETSSLNTYELDPEKGAALLKEAGWTQDGSDWKTPDGSRAEFELIFPAEYADWSATGQDVAEQLTTFGIKIEPRAITYTQQPIDVNKGNFELAIRGWGNSSNPHPHYSYTQALFTHNTLAKLDGGTGMDFPMIQETEVLGKVDLEQLTIDSALGLDEEKQRGNVANIALAFNELLPVVPLWERFGNNAALEGVRVKAWPADDDPLLKNSFYADGIPTMLIYTGDLEPV